MTIKDKQGREFLRIMCAATLLAINAGFINAASIVGLYRKPVSHVTGTVSNMAADAVLHKGEDGIVLLGILLSFIFGAFLSGLIVGKETLRMKRRYGVAMMVVGSLLFLSFAFLRQTWRLAECLAAAACGLQNGLTTNYSGAIIRTTHMTGIATDIGNILALYIRTRHTHDLWKLKVFIPLLCGYFIGGLLGTAIYQSLGIYCLVIPASASLFGGAGYSIFRTIRAARLEEFQKLPEVREPIPESQVDRMAELEAQIEQELSNDRNLIPESDSEDPWGAPGRTPRL
eukprot:Colp12_sorted_trinity150504_noHs@28500